MELLKNAKVDWTNKRLNITSEKELTKLVEEAVKEWGSQIERS